jgi:hypothetical protein
VDEVVGGACFHFERDEEVVGTVEDGDGFHVKVMLGCMER